MYRVTHFHVSGHANLSRVHPHACTALRHISPERACPCLFACIGLASTRFARSLFSFHPQTSPSPTHTHFISLLLIQFSPYLSSRPLCLSLWMHHFVEFKKQGGWLAREALLLHVHVAYGSCLLLRTHVAYGPLLLRTRVAYGICLCYCVPVLHTGICLAIAYPCCIWAFAIAYPCCIWDCDLQRHTSPPCRHASLSCHLCLTACCYSRGIGLNWGLTGKTI